MPTDRPLRALFRQSLPEAVSTNGVRLLARGAVPRHLRYANPHGWAVACFALVALCVLLMVPAITRVFGLHAVLAWPD